MVEVVLLEWRYILGSYNQLDSYSAIWIVIYLLSIGVKDGLDIG